MTYIAQRIRIQGSEVNPIHIGSTDFQQECHNKSMGKEQFFQQRVLGQLDIYMQEHKSEFLPHTAYKSNLRQLILKKGEE